MFRSATVKLTLWYVLLATGLSLLFSVVAYHLSTEELSEALQHQYHTFVQNDYDRDNVPLPYSVIRQHGQHLLGQLVWFNAIVVISSTGVGYVLARRTLKPIEEAHQAQVRFTAEASHELRTPLAAIRADTEVALMKKGLSPNVTRTLQGNLQDIGRLEQLTSHLLDIARYQHHVRPLMEPVDLDETVRVVLQQFTHAFKQKPLTVTTDIQPLQILGERYALERLLTIVVDNAVKYSAADGTISVTLRRRDELADLTVTDSGIGISPKDLPHVFERFYRSRNHGDEANMSLGYGLGLPLAQEIVRAHHGNIYLTSQVNDGTTVHISLPILRPA